MTTLAGLLALALSATPTAQPLLRGSVKATGSTTARNLADRFADVVNVKDFGAKGDGLSDDTNAIQAAINAALKNGADVLLPPVARGASYKFTRLYFQYDASKNPGAPQGRVQSRPVRLLGAGAHSDLGTHDPADWARSLLVSTDATGPALEIDGGPSYAARQVMLQGLTVIASNSTFVVKMRNANTGSGLRDVLVVQNGSGGGVDWDTTWMMGIEKVTIQAGALALTPGTVGLRVRCNTAGGGQIWADQVTVQRAYQQRTTGSIMKGTSKLTVASAIDFARGQQISVQGAGAGGNWLDTTITTIAGSTIALADAAGTTVAGASVRHGGGFDIGIQVGALTGEAGYDYFFNTFECRLCMSQWNRTGFVVGGRVSNATFSSPYTEGNRLRAFYITNRAGNVRVSGGYLNDLRAADAGVLIDSATAGTAMHGLTIENTWFPNIHNAGVKFVDGTHTSGRLVGNRFTKQTDGTPGAGVGVYTGGHTTPWSVEQNIFDASSGLVAYDDSTKFAWRAEKDGTGTYTDRVAGAVGGTGITKSVRATTTTDVASMEPGTCSADVTVTVTGAAMGAECIVGGPAALPASVVLDCFVSAADTVKLRVCNNSAGRVDPPSLTYSVRVFNP